MLELIVEHQAGIPVLMKPLSGNSSDGKEFGRIVQEYIAPLGSAADLHFNISKAIIYRVLQIHTSTSGTRPSVAARRGPRQSSWSA
jgi:hypothetical protein